METPDTPLCAVTTVSITLVQTVHWARHLTGMAKETLNAAFSTIPSDGFAAVVNTVIACVVTV